MDPLGSLNKTYSMVIEQEPHPPSSILIILFLLFRISISTEIELTTINARA